MSRAYEFHCPDCSYTGQHYRNRKRCPKCGGWLRRNETPIVEILDELRARVDWLESQLSDTAIQGFAVRHGARALWQAWRDTMINQGRPVAAERMDWDTLPEIDKELDTAIAAEVLYKFALHILSEDA